MSIGYIWVDPSTRIQLHQIGIRVILGGSCSGSMNLHWSSSSSTYLLFLFFSISFSHFHHYIENLKTGVNEGLVSLFFTILVTWLELKPQGNNECLPTVQQAPVHFDNYFSQMMSSSFLKYEFSITHQFTISWVLFLLRTTPPLIFSSHVSNRLIERGLSWYSKAIK